MDAVSRLVVMFTIISMVNNMWICHIFLNPIALLYFLYEFLLHCAFGTLSHIAGELRFCRWWQLWVVMICIKTIAFSRRTFLPAECFRHIPHNVSSFYSNIVQYKFSHPTLHLLLKNKAKGLNTCSLPPHSLLTMFPPYTYYCTLCFQKH